MVVAHRELTDARLGERGDGRRLEQRQRLRGAGEGEGEGEGEEEGEIESEGEGQVRLAGCAGGAVRAALSATLL
jgi:hypothetical protein